MNYPDEAYQRLGQLLAAERGGRSRAAVSAACGVGARTIQEYEDGKAFRKPPQKLWDLLRFYRWTPDSLGRVLAGGLPEYIPETPPTTITPAEYAQLVEMVNSHPTLPRNSKRRLLKAARGWVSLNAI